MGLELPRELDELEGLLPELDVSVDAHRDDDLAFGGRDDWSAGTTEVDDVFVHEALFVELCGRQVLPDDVRELRGGWSAEATRVSGLGLERPDGSGLQSAELLELPDLLFVDVLLGLAVEEVGVQLELFDRRGAVRVVLCVH